MKYLIIALAMMMFLFHYLCWFVNRQLEEPSDLGRNIKISIYGSLLCATAVSTVWLIFYMKQVIVIYFSSSTMHYCKVTQYTFVIICMIILCFLGISAILKAHDVTKYINHFKK